MVDSAWDDHVGERQGQIMSTDTLLALLFGMLAGGVFGWLTAWRFARKLEHHEVRLSDWDRPYDMPADSQPARIIRPEQFGS